MPTASVLCGSQLMSGEYYPQDSPEEAEGSDEEGPHWSGRLNYAYLVSTLPVLHLFLYSSLRLMLLP